VFVYAVHVVQTGEDIFECQWPTHCLVLEVTSPDVSQRVDLGLYREVQGSAAEKLYQTEGLAGFVYITYKKYHLTHGICRYARVCFSFLLLWSGVAASKALYSERR